MALADNCFGKMPDEEYNQLVDEAREMAIAKRQERMHQAVEELPEELQMIVNAAFEGGNLVHILSLNKES